MVVAHQDSPVSSRGEPARPVTVYTAPGAPPASTRSAPCRGTPPTTTSALHSGRASHPPQARAMTPPTWPPCWRLLPTWWRGSSCRPRPSSSFSAAARSRCVRCVAPHAHAQAAPAGRLTDWAWLMSTGAGCRAHSRLSLAVRHAVHQASCSMAPGVHGMKALLLELTAVRGRVYANQPLEGPCGGVHQPGVYWAWGHAHRVPALRSAVGVHMSGRGEAGCAPWMHGWLHPPHTCVCGSR
jgi:hypothetical protein